ncbi:hypothetical protein O7622_05655 [Micromonospora sp. WMMD1076]|uniref:hypothetical protein n=1 Tax=Micromonospora sp. WMMD1076 TaxID=3016103 RepID=UPI00249AB102|nr:hypothetical protein [Micromonospora sp. WMMD1076]WFF08058.1 hypothetical protein O7622_05655 [Micromonospora sp. WMMD1076]
MTYWVEKNPPPPSPRALKLADELENSMQPAASGGGCKNTQGLGVCISWAQSTSRLNSDFYVNSFSGVSSSGTARLYINYKGTNYYQYTVLTDHFGKYPTAQFTTSGSGVGYTLVDTFNQNGSSIGGGTSPYQYFP